MTVIARPGGFEQSSPDMDVTVRKAGSESDIEFISRRFQETIALWEDYRVTEKSIVEQKGKVREWIRDEKMHLTVAVGPDGTTLGFNSLHVTKTYNGDPLGKIIILYVCPEYRKHGIGRHLKQEGENWMRSKGAQQVLTEIDARNSRMLQINKKAGFRTKSYMLVKDLSESDAC